jgi:hypothetical protein
MFSFEDPKGNVHEQRIPFEREQLEQMLDSARRKKP